MICEASKLSHKGIAVSLESANADNVCKISDFNGSGTEQHNKPVIKSTIFVKNKFLAIS